MEIKKYPHDKLYLVAVSGGPDSMALLSLLKDSNYQVIVCFVNYHHRNNVDEEQKMVEDYVRSLSYRLEIKHCYFDNSDNFENWAREQRYDFFAEMMKKYRAESCFVGHHLDDLIETYFLQLERGYVNYYGLKEQVSIKGVEIIRPLLKYSKASLLDYCLTNHIPYSYDYTNEDISLKRNYLRHRVLKDISYLDKDKILLEIAQKNQEIDLINKKIEKLLSDELNINDFNKLSLEEQDRLIFRYVNKYSNLTLSKRRIGEVKRKLLKKGNVVIDLDDNYQLIKEYDSLNLVKKELYNYCIVVNEPTIIENYYIKFDLVSAPKKFFIKSDSYPLTIRNASKGEKIKIGKIHKSINRILIDEKIPYLKRLYWPEIVNNKNEIIFVPRRDIDEDGLFIVKSKKNML